MNKTWGMVSFILFCLGLVLSIVGGIVIPGDIIVAMALTVIGLIIGIIYVIFTKDIASIHTLLLATIVLLAMAAAFTPITILNLGKIASSILTHFATLMAPVALICAIKALLTLGLEPKVKI
jgi:hypothetical protein